jgi:hypothetical protein
MTSMDGRRYLFVSQHDTVMLRDIIFGLKIHEHRHSNVVNSNIHVKLPNMVIMFLPQRITTATDIKNK